MNALQEPMWIVDTTSGFCSRICRLPLFRVGTFALCLVFGDLSLPATASTTYQIHGSSERTNSGPDAQASYAAVDTVGDAVLELRRRSGLTWDELASLFDVTRRSLHHWSNGKPVAAKHERAIRQALVAVRHLDLGASADTRALLLTAGLAGVSYFDLLRAGQADEVIASMGERSAATTRVRMPLSREALEARRPPAPDLLVGAIEPKIDTPAKARLTRVARLPRSAG